MRRISKKVKEELENAVRMESCEICGKKEVQWHHVLQYAGRQIDEPFAIAPACFKHHEQATTFPIREQFEWYALQRMTDADLAKYPIASIGYHLKYLISLAEEYGW